MNFKTTATLICTGLLLFGCATSPPDRSRLFSEWNIPIDQPIRQLEEILAELEQQQPMNYTISNVAFLYDAKLFILFHEFIDQLSESVRASEIAEQRKWLTIRKAQIHKAYSEYEGGTMASYAAGLASIDATKKRIAEIEKRMKALPTTKLTLAMVGSKKKGIFNRSYSTVR